MKNNSFFYFAITAVFLFSCKKERTCVCTINETGVKTIQNQQAGFSIGFIPGMPPIEITPSTNIITENPYSRVSVDNQKYKKITKGNLKQICTLSSKEIINESTVEVSGTSTITTTDNGTIETNCKIK